MSWLYSRKFFKNSLIGFCGGPWTVACYMINGKSDSEFKRAINSIKENKSALEELLDKIVNLSVTHLYHQYASGCDTLMIFESWAGLVPNQEYEDILIKPIEKIIYKLKALGVHAPIIVLPRGINKNILEYVDKISMDILSVDYSIDIAWLIQNIKKDTVLQGNLNPSTIKKGGKMLEDEVNKLLSITKGRNHIFCSGHGLLPETPIQNVKRAIDIIKN